MPVDNDLYSRMSDSWWDDQGVLNVIRGAINPPRFGYIRRILRDTLHIDPRGKRVLDVGSGGGLLAEEVASLGCQVFGIDPSAASVEVAKAHAAKSGLNIDYRTGVGENIPFDDRSFDIVYCCDVLEHVNDLPKVISEIARVLADGGVFFFDTINRTFKSKLLLIKLLQEWDATALLPDNLHDWNMFIKPSELVAINQRNGLETKNLVGIAPSRNPLAVIRILRQRRKGQLTYSEAGRQMNFAESKDQSALYMGHAIKVATASGH